MKVDKAPANCKFYKNLRSGDTGRRRVEHRSILKLSVSIAIPLRFRPNLHYDELK